MKLLSREEFRNAVFERDGHRCVQCGRSAGVDDFLKVEFGLDAHHIIERRLWSDGGYYLDNGATLCSTASGLGCHMAAETTRLSVEEIRLIAGIRTVLVPDDMYRDVIYDKWGNVVLANGRRSRGPLFNDESVRKVIESQFDLDELFTNLVKYPRTYHLPWSPGITDDDRIMKDTSAFHGHRVIVTRKMDGENFTGYNDGCHARSVDGQSHYTRNWAKGFWMERAFNLPDGWRLCAENLYATHSIRYETLPSYLMAFSIWNNQNACLPWDETVELCQLLEIEMVPVLYDGIYDEAKIKALHTPGMDAEHEGYVIRLADGFSFASFRKSVAKYVRKGHVQTQKHWFYGRNDHEINGMKKNA